MNFQSGNVTEPQQAVFCVCIFIRAVDMIEKQTTQEAGKIYATCFKVCLVFIVSIELTQDITS